MGWIDKIQKAIEDTITLDVVTATGKIELKRPDPEEGAIEAGAAEAGNLAAAAAGGVAGAAPQEHGFERIAAEVSYLVQNTQLEVVAFTHSEWDCDTFAFVKSDLTPSEAKLVETHAATVAAAHDTRRKAVQMLKSVL